MKSKTSAPAKPARYRVKARGSHKPVWEVEAATEAQARERVALATRLPLHTLTAERL